MKAAHKFQVRVEDLDRLAGSLREIAGTLEWLTGLREVLDGLGAGCGSHEVQRGAALITESACRVVEAMANELATTAWLAESAAETYRTVEATVMLP